MAQSAPGDEFRPVELEAHTPAASGAILDPEKKATLEENRQPQNMASPLMNKQYLMRKFFVARPGAFQQAVDDLSSQILAREKETVHNAWLLTEVDHWNNEKERVVLITDHFIFISKYDFITLCNQEIQKIPLNCIDRICQGPFMFPQNSLDKREGDGLRIHWDKLHEVPFLSRWNPMSREIPYTTFIDHPLRNYSEQFETIGQVSHFAAHLINAVQEAHKANPVPGRANGALILNQPLLIETYVGFMSFIGNRNKLGYSLARGSIGF
ncbi:tumor protein p63-regulated gene 1 protein [Hyperolius riggenbachi]|uniref:tumor protein p63-regulated gene 1 protein n=1 Tax=Hyperolius riggenbachi TaxID=752182 RepID=UPI0035A300E4